ncbi:cytidylyltransferase domain-containing protein [Methanoplanus endosymbiosus]|uniref:3-deoxy-manno-octulosonate cytidylyltransferase n=1 Tax=Methanoplanus endosymbiosus TaxID=33865 RepID=A0A9E7TID0_9EURY|nr:NTP transferase domain-containing protein [Methanoplanus endosymbiosus]UUX92248.1 hypothetical protein L6E24_12990 [Methanoplanus endosymbiosus]
MDKRVDVGVVIICRQSSTRLPGKALLEIDGKPILKYILERLMTIFDKSSIIIATSIEKEDDGIENFADKEGIDCYRGSLNNVAIRFYKAAAQKGWDYAIRINGDNVFVNTEAITALLTELNQNHYLFLTNKKDQTFPTGMSVEIVNIDYYKAKLDEICEEDKYMEHVTLLFYDIFSCEHKYYYNTSVPEAAKLQLALDTPEDLYKIKQIISKFSEDHRIYHLQQIYTIARDLGYV